MRRPGMMVRLFPQACVWCIPAVLFVTFLLTPSPARAEGQAAPVVDVKAPPAPVRAGERFTVAVEIKWDGEGADLEVGRPSFDVPENLVQAASSQESRTVLRDGSPRSTKEYGLVFTAEKEGVYTIGPVSLNAKRGEEEFALAGKAVDITVVRGVSRSVVMWGIWIGVLILGVVMYLTIRRYGRSNPAGLL